MKRLVIIGQLLCFAIGSFGQDDQIMVFDASSFSTSLKSVNSDEINKLDLKQTTYNTQWQVPEINNFIQVKNSSFSGMIPADNVIHNDLYPASASVKIVAIHGDTTWDKCSGMLVGDKYVLTAAHCVISDVDDWKDIKSFIPYLYVKPGYNNGRESKYGRIKVSKTYIFKSYYSGKSKKDIALLELEDPIGQNTGWVKMGFQDDNDLISRTKFLNFSYPMDGVRVNYHRDFNGDTMYLKLGYADLVSQNYIGINSVGIPGESGSLLISGEEGNFTAYGVRNFSEMKYSFYRLKREEVSAFYNIIYRKSTISEQPLASGQNPVRGIKIYPNPVFEKAIITANPDIDMIQVSLYDVNSAEVFNTSIEGSNGKFVLENYNLPRGNYFLIAKQNNTFLGAVNIMIKK